MGEFDGAPRSNLDRLCLTLLLLGPPSIPPPIGLPQAQRQRQSDRKKEKRLEDQLSKYERDRFEDAVDLEVANRISTMES
jgi:hypothetical protein